MIQEDTGGYTGIEEDTELKEIRFIFSMQLHRCICPKGSECN